MGNKSNFIARNAMFENLRYCSLIQLKYNKLNLNNKKEPEILVGFLAQLFVFIFQYDVNRKDVIIIILMF